MISSSISSEFDSSDSFDFSEDSNSDELYSSSSRFKFCFRFFILTCPTPFFPYIYSIVNFFALFLDIGAPFLPILLILPKISSIVYCAFPNPITPDE
jgi:hypothetical protein